MNISKPTYVIEEKRLRANLELISRVAKEADVEIILAFKAYALWRTFPIFREYIRTTTASSLCEALLAYREFGTKAHTFSPAYNDNEIDTIADCSSHITFNSWTQIERYNIRVRARNHHISCGIRINPRYSEIETPLYNPCARGTRFGIAEENMPEVLPAAIEGFHCHNHCESGSDAFERSLAHVEQKFGRWFDQIKWINFGGGHLMTRKGYDTQRLIRVLNDFHKRYPHLHVILEPGSAFGWQTGPLVSHVVDIVEDSGIRTAILDVSFTCHMPDCLEMPYQPTVRHATTMPMDAADPESEIGKAYAGKPIYRLGGCSCLAGDVMGSWLFEHELEVGESIIFEDMNHYTTVKTTMFNGITHPSIALLHADGTLETLREYGYEDYRDRMD